MARAPDMPPMVVSSSPHRFLDIEPYGNKLRASDPIKWGSVFPWEFPQAANRHDEEEFLRSWFSEDEIHVQGGVGDAENPGAGFRFLKQVWYSQAIWNWEVRAPAVCEWWWSKPDNVALFEDPKMQKFFLADDTKSSTFFDSAEVRTYGEKFLDAVMPLIQTTARIKLEGSQAEGKLVSKGHTPRADPALLPAVSTSEPPSTTLSVQTPMPHLTKVSSQPGEVKAKMISPPPTAPQSTAPAFAHPHVPNGNEQQVLIERSPFNRRRGYSGNIRYSNRGGYVQPRPPHHPPEVQQVPPPVQGGYRSVSCMAPGFEPYPHFVPADPPVFPSPRDRGHIGFANVPPPVQGMYGGYAGFEPQQQNGMFGVPPFDPSQSGVVWASNPAQLPIHDRTNQGFRQASYDMPYEGAYPPRGGFNGEFRGRKSRGSFGDRGRGRGSRGGRSSFGSHGQASTSEFSGRWTSGEIRMPGSGGKGRRNSVISTERNWRSGSDHPQQDFDMNENVAPVPSQAGYVPAPFIGGFAGYHPTPHEAQALPPPAVHGAGPQDTSDLQVPPDHPRRHCTQSEIGDLCAYANKLTVFDIPNEVHDHAVARFFNSFGKVQRAARAPGGRYSNPLAPRLAFVIFESPQEARKCMLNRPTTWPSDGRTIRVEVSKEYWDPGHRMFRIYRPDYHVGVASFPNSAFSLQNEPSTSYGHPPAHQHHDSASTIRPVPEQVASGPGLHDVVNASGETTPTISGSNTPNKKKKGKGKKQNKDLRAASLSTEVQKGGETSDVAAEDAGEKPAVGQPVQAPAAEGSPVDDKPELSLSIEKQRSASETTERQAVSEPSLTPVDKVTTKLPMSNVHEAQEQASDVPIDASSAAEASTTDDANAVDDAQSNLHGVGQSFREDEEEKETAASTADVAESDQQLSVSDGSEKAEKQDELVDESSHTATGTTESTETPNATDNDALLDRSAVEIDGSHALPLDEENKMTGDSAQVKSETPVLVVDTASATNAESRRGSRSASGGSALVPSSAFVTAPNTPVVDQNTIKAEATEDAPYALVKTEKAKGPSQTESFSMFGKKQKKSKPEKKKSTLKGKPKELAGSAPQDNFAPSTAAPQSMVEPGKVSSLAAGGKKHVNIGAAAKSKNNSKDLDGDTSNGIPAGGGATSTLAGTLPPTDDEPVKRKGSIIDNIARLFTGNQSQSNDQEKLLHKPKTDKTLLTGDKATKDRIEEEAIEEERVDEVFEEFATPDDRGADVADEVGPSHIADQVDGGDDDDEPFASGLGIANVDGIDRQADIKAKKKKKGKKSKKKGKQAASEVGIPNSVDDTEDDGAQESSGSLMPSSTFRFRFQANSPSFPGSARSDASSHTMGDATPESGPTSPVATKMPRKLPSTSPSSVLQEKEPQWKNRKRTYRGVIGPEESVADDDSNKSNYALESVDSNSTASGASLTINLVSGVDSATGMNTPRTVFWLLNGGRNRTVILNASNEGGAGEDVNKHHHDVAVGENSTVKESKAKMQRLLEQESSRKHGHKVSQAKVSEKSRIEELSKLYPGRPIVEIQRVDNAEG